MKLKQACTIYSDYGINISADEYVETGIPIIRTSDMSDNGNLDLSEAKYIPADLVGRKLLKDGDILLSRSGTIGRATIFRGNQPATFAAYLVRFRTKANCYTPRFIGYWTQSAAYWNQIKQDTIQSTIGNFNAYKFANLVIPEHDLPTQRAIADFLDRETARIDLLIEKKQRLVELLDEKQSSLITSRVTGQQSFSDSTIKTPNVSEGARGGDCFTAEGGGGVNTLDTNRLTVRQRLIEDNEFPNIPNNWTVERLRFLFRESKERNGKNPVGEMLSVSEYRGVVPREYDNEDQKRSDEELENYRVVRPGQLAVNSMWLNHLGLGVSDHLGHVSPAYNVYDISNRLDKRFTHHLMRSNYYLKIYLRYLYGIRPNSFQIKSNDWASIPIIVPDLPTQRAIADFLDRETARIKTLQTSTRKSIDILREYRSTLVTAAVTGQIIIRDSKKTIETQLKQTEIA